MRIGFACLLLSFAALAGCGGRPPPAGAQHSHFRVIQRHEADIDRSRPALAPDRDCSEACSAAPTLCDAAGAICDIAESTGDADALTRCEHARRVCLQADDRARVCECERS